MSGASAAAKAAALFIFDIKMHAGSTPPVSLFLKVTETAVGVLGLGGLGCGQALSRDMPLSELLGILDSAEKGKMEFSAVVDLR